MGEINQTGEPNTMKKVVTTISAAIFALGLTSAGLAQTTQTPAKPEVKKESHHGPDPGGQTRSRQTGSCQARNWPRSGKTRRSQEGNHQGSQESGEEGSQEGQD